MKNKENQIKMAAMFFIIALIGSIVFLGYFTYITKKVLREDMNHHLESIAVFGNHYVENFLEEQEKIFYETFDEELFARFLVLSPEDEEYNDTMKKVFDKLDSSRAIGGGIANSSGIIIADKVRSMIGIDSLSSVPELYNGGRKDIEYYIVPSGPSTLILGPGRSIFDANNNVVGAFGIKTSLDELKDTLKSIYKFKKSAEIYLVNNDLLLLTPSKYLKGENKGVLTQKVDTENTRNCFKEGKHGQEYDIANMKDGGHETVSSFLDYRGEKVFGTHIFLPEIEWCLLVEVDYNEYLGERLKGLIIQNILLCLILVTILTLIGYCIGKKFNGGRR